MSERTLIQFFLQHAPVMWNDRQTCRCGRWAVNRDSDEIARSKAWAEHMEEEMLDEFIIGPAASKPEAAHE